jgi:hypothetical protein
MLTSQRDLFDIPRDVCYLNSASYSPLPLKTQEAARATRADRGRSMPALPAASTSAREPPPPASSTPMPPMSR